jgi:hypothetical protein
MGHYGRLGNQMYQYSLLYSVGKKNGYEVAIPIDNQSIIDGRYNPVIGKNDRYGLDLYRCFEINATSVDNFEIESEIQNQFRERLLGFDPDVFNVPDGTNFEGYFQSWKFFEDYFDEIRKEFIFTSEVIDKTKSWLSSSGIDESKTLVSVHIRRGDGIVDDGEFQVFLGMEYYHSALGVLKREGIKNPQILVFSDDVEWCKVNAIFNEDTTYVDTSVYDSGYVRSHYIDLCLMSQCHHNIMANSTYSWWGAFLNKNKDAKTVVPKEWWGWRNKTNSEEYLRLDHWIKL